MGLLVRQARRRCGPAARIHRSAHLNPVSAQPRWTDVDPEQVGQLLRRVARELAAHGAPEASRSFALASLIAMVPSTE